MSEAITQAIKEAQRLIDELAPVPRGILLSPLVPVDRLVRQWDTNGDLWIWMNSGALEDLPKRSYDAFDLPLFGIPVYAKGEALPVDQVVSDMESPQKGTQDRRCLCPGPCPRLGHPGALDR